MVRRIRCLRTRDVQKNKAFTDEGRTEESGVYGRGNGQKSKAFTDEGMVRRIRRLRTTDEQKKKTFTDEGRTEE